MPYVYKPRQDLRPRDLDGISEEQIAQHWTLYEGYVKNVNLLNEHAGQLSKKGEFGPEFAEIKRHLGFEYDGMILHEHYFSTLKAGQEPPGNSSVLTKALKQAFGGFESWRKEFDAIGKMRGVGWAILYYDPRVGTLSSNWISMHEGGHPAGFVPLLVMDVWEHAYMVDWGAGGRASYVDAFFKNVDWPRVERNLTEVSAVKEVFQHIA
jgi:Fe-Mn family superoxide dismutase